MRRWAIILTIMLATGIESRAQDPGMAFLRMGTYADHAALADTYTAYVGGAASMYGNPAGLAVGGSDEAVLSYQSWIASTSIYAASVRMHSGRAGSFGVSVAVFDGGDIDVQAPPGPDDSPATQSIAAAAGYAYALGPLRLGATAKFLAERIYGADATGFALDFGAQASFMDDNLLFGASVHNVGSMQELGAVATELPLMIRIGAAGYPVRVYSGTGSEPTFRFFVSPEIVIFHNEDVQRLRLGVGGEMSELLSVRIGFLPGEELRRLTFGAGVLYSGFQFDYAFMPLQEGFGGPSHMLTLTYGW